MLKRTSLFLNGSIMLSSIVYAQESESTERLTEAMPESQEAEVADAADAVTQTATGELGSGLFFGGMLGTSYVATEFQRQYGLEQDESGVSLMFYGGYDFNKYFGLESSTMVVGGIAEGARSEVDGAAAFTLTFTPKFRWPVTDRFTLYGKAGLLLMSYAEEYQNTYIVGGGDTLGWAGLGYTAGVGVEFKLQPNVFLRFSYDYTQTELKSEDDYVLVIQPPSAEATLYSVPDMDAEVHQFMVGAHYHFGYGVSKK